MDFELVADGLGFPEGPVVMSDGSVIVVVIQKGQISRHWGKGKSEVVATPGGGPNGLAIGPDGALWCCNNGGFQWANVEGLLIPGNAADDYSGGRIERIDLSTGKVERVLDTVDGNKLKGPNDLVFDKAGNLYFTDHGKSYSRHRDLRGADRHVGFHRQGRPCFFPAEPGEGFPDRGPTRVRRRGKPDRDSAG